MGPKIKKLKTNNEETAEESSNLQSAGGNKASHVDNIKNSTTVKPVANISVAQRLLNIEENQCEELLKLDYGQGICYIYNPVDYAREIHSDFVTKYGNGEKKVLMLGMNPGPWGMGQTGVPFGHVGYAKDWLGVKGNVSKPQKEHPKRPVTGLECTRSEVSGDRMWALLKELSGTPQVLFSRVFLHNYCPLFFLKDSAKNVTPPELKVKERAKLQGICDDALVKTIKLLGVEHIIGVGNYATDRARAALLKAGMESVQMTDQQKDQWMSEAFSQAKVALASGEVPVGCVCVFNGEIIARGRNTVNETHNATRHAEMNCIDQVLMWCKSKLLDHRTVFPKISIFVTVEPCGMCADALGQLHVSDITYGCSNDRFGGCGSVVNIPKLYKYPMKIQKGIQAEEAVELLKAFYKGENPNAPTGKAKRKIKNT